MVDFKWHKETISPNFYILSAFQYLKATTILNVNADKHTIANSNSIQFLDKVGKIVFIGGWGLKSQLLSATSTINNNNNDTNNKSINNKVQINANSNESDSMKLSIPSTNIGINIRGDAVDDDEDEL